MTAGSERGPQPYRNPGAGIVIKELKPTNKKCLHCEKILPYGTHLKIDVDPKNQWRRKCIPCGNLIDPSGAVVEIRMFKKSIKDSVDLLEHQDCIPKYQSPTTEVVPNDDYVPEFVELAIVRDYPEFQIIEFVQKPIESPPVPSVGQELGSAVHKG